MKIRRNYRLPEAQQKTLAKAVRLEWITIFFLLTITFVMYLTMGASQAMRTAWIEDLLSLVPPIAFLVSVHFRKRAPSRRYPYGFRRLPTLAFLIAAVAILILGLYMFFDAARSLIGQEHPALGQFDLFGWYVWSGWVMIVALIYSMIPPLILGHMKLPLAKEVHEKTLYAGATMNKDDWLTAGAAILGILGIGLGWWWADAVAAGFISIEVVMDGFKNVQQAMADLAAWASTGPSAMRIWSRGTARPKRSWGWPATARKISARPAAVTIPCRCPSPTWTAKWPWPPTAWAWR